MDEPKPPWWRTKRWWAAGVLLVLVLYPLRTGPACYAVGRGWLQQPTYAAVYAPVFWTTGRLIWNGPPKVVRSRIGGGPVSIGPMVPPEPTTAAGRAAKRYTDFVGWFGGLGWRHRLGLSESEWAEMMSQE
jgi:hypothetical protein